MSWIFIALIPPALYAVSNLIDKYLVSTYFKGEGVGSVMVFSSLIGLVALPIIVLISPDVLSIDAWTALFIVLNGMLYILSFLPYFHALHKEDASVVAPLFQAIPVFAYVLGYVILGESLSLTQSLAGLVIFIGAIGISLDLSGSRFAFKGSIFGLMMLSSFGLALNGALFKFFAIEEHFWVTSFWTYAGFFLLGLVLLAMVRSYRQQFFAVFRDNGRTIVALNGVNELLALTTTLIFNYASLLAPLVLVYLVGAAQPFFVFFYGLILTLLFPRFINEDISSKTIIQKLACMILMVIGSYFLLR
jgi:drug/metabolite transporter (DMT)-like permease